MSDRAKRDVGDETLSTLVTDTLQRLSDGAACGSTTVEEASAMMQVTALKLQLMIVVRLGAIASALEDLCESGRLPTMPMGPIA